MNIAAKIAILKLEITKASPINDAVIINVMALIINRKKPNVRNVTGKVSMTRIGLTIKLIIDNSTLASIAADALSK